MRLCWVVLLVGCYRPSGFDPCVTACGPTGNCPNGLACDNNGLCKAAGDPDDCVVPDGGLPFEDAPIDGMLSPQAVCWGGPNDFFTTCVDPEPTNVFAPAASLITINTTACTEGYVQPQAAPPGVCVIAAQSIHILPTTTLRAIGDKPLALFAVSTLIVDGTIDVSSNGITVRGAGANAGGGCSMAMAGDAGGGGGAAGALAFSGGAGGRAGDGTAGGLATPAVAPAALQRVRGGCRGAGGGNSQNGLGGLGGLGGGAVYLLTPGTLALGATSRINASGGGGRAPGVGGGGGGGGSGGFIGFHAAAYAIDASARAFAIGGGGASGGGGGAGEDGFEATGPMDTLGRAGMLGGGSGGQGTSSKGADGTFGTGEAETSGGGGGGGGGGMIGFEGTIPANAVSFRPQPGAL